MVRHPVLHVHVGLDSLIHVISQDKRSDTGTNIADQDDEEKEGKESGCSVIWLLRQVPNSEEGREKEEGSKDDDGHRRDEVLTREATTT